MLEIQLEDLLDCARYGELDDIRAYVEEVQQIRGSATPSKAVTDRVDFLGWKGIGGKTVLHMASANGHLDLVKYILDLLPLPVQDHINATNDEGNTPLHWACMNGHAEVTELLITNGADGKIQNSAGHTCLFYAQENGKDDVVDMLLRMVDYEADAESDDDIGEGEQGACTSEQNELDR